MRSMNASWPGRDKRGRAASEALCAVFYIYLAFYCIQNTLPFTIGYVAWFTMYMVFRKSNEYEVEAGRTG